MMSKEQQKLLYEISMIDFAIVELNEYLDTHPYDTESVQYIAQYNRVKNKMMREYASKYSPLAVRYAEDESEWSWTMTPLPWEGGCN